MFYSLKCNEYQLKCNFKTIFTNYQWREREKVKRGGKSAAILSANIHT